jgi:hypothetical protein
MIQLVFLFIFHFARSLPSMNSMMTMLSDSYDASLSSKCGDEFDNDIPSRFNQRLCAKRHTIRNVFQKTNIFEKNAFIAVRDRREIVRLRR